LERAASDVTTIGVAVEAPAAKELGLKSILTIHWKRYSTLTANRRKAHSTADRLSISVTKIKEYMWQHSVDSMYEKRNYV